MASKATTYNRGDMDIREHKATYGLVMKLIKWGSLALVVLLLIPTLWFCTETGAAGSFLMGLVVAALGVFVLREKAGAH